jgi:hypothetical protein
MFVVLKKKHDVKFGDEAKAMVACCIFQYSRAQKIPLRVDVITVSIFIYTLTFH